MEAVEALGRVVTQSNDPQAASSGQVAQKPASRQAIDISLPLPVDVVATLGNLLDAAYPGTDIDLTAGSNCLRLLLPEGHRKAKKVSKKAAADAVVEHDGEDVEVVGMEVTETGLTLSMSPPEELALRLLPLVRATLGMPGAVNYVEQHLAEKEPPYREYVVIACRSDKQTPHALRQAAEAKLERVLDTLGRYDESCEDMCECCSTWRSTISEAIREADIG